MKRYREIDIQEAVIEKLQDYNISPFSVIFSYEAGDSNGILGITFYIQSDLDEILDILDYRSQCDRTGYVIIRDTNTILFSGMALLNLYTKL